MKLNGWLRLWAFASLIWSALVAVLGWSLFDAAGYVSDAAIVDRLRNDYPSEFDSLTTSEDATPPGPRGRFVPDLPPGFQLDRAPRDLLADNPQAKIGAIRELHRRGVPAPGREGIVSAIQEIEADRWSRVDRPMLFWLWSAPIVVVLLFGHGVAWVIRGFRTQ